MQRKKYYRNQHKYQGGVLDVEQKQNEYRNQIEGFGGDGGVIFQKIKKQYKRKDIHRNIGRWRADELKKEEIPNRQQTDYQIDFVFIFEIIAQFFNGENVPEHQTKATQVIEVFIQERKIKDTLRNVPATQLPEKKVQVNESLHKTVFIEPLDGLYVIRFVVNHIRTRSTLRQNQNQSDQ